MGLQSSIFFRSSVYKAKENFKSIAVVPQVKLLFPCKVKNSVKKV